LQKYMESLPEVNNSQSLADLICNMNEVMNGHYTIPETKEQVANLLFMLEGEDIIDQMVNKDYSEGIVQARFGSLDTKLMSEAVDAIDHYLESEMDSVITVVRTSQMTPDNLQKIKSFQIKRAGQELSLDAKKRLPSAQIDQSGIEERINVLAANMNFPLSNEYQNALRDRLRMFFEEEADIEIDSEKIIARLVNLIADKAKKGMISEDGVATLLKKNVPFRYWQEDPESVESTAEFVVSIINEQHKHNRISILVGKLLPLFPAELQQNEKFLDDIRDDLWLLNEEIIGVPLRTNFPDSEYKVRLTATQSGMLRVMKKMNDELLASQIRSLFLALGLVLVLMALQFKSIKMGLIVTSPIFLTVLINFAVMG